MPKSKDNPHLNSPMNLYLFYILYETEYAINITKKKAQYILTWINKVCYFLK